MDGEHQNLKISRAVEGIFKQSVVDKIAQTIDYHVKTIHQIYYGGSSPTSITKKLHINDLLECLEKRYGGAIESYANLCEYVHPNYGSNALVSGGILAVGKVGIETQFSEDEAEKARKIIERCTIVSNDIILSTTGTLIRISNAIEFCRLSNAKISQIFSLRSSHQGEGKSKEDAIVFHKARIRVEQIQAFYKYLEEESLELIDRQTVGIEGGVLFSKVVTDKGVLWFRYKI